MAHEVFISYASEDKPIADAVCAKLEASKIRCWIAPRDILPGQQFGHAIIDAIDNSKIFFLIFSSHTNFSPYIIREIDRAVKNGYPIIPFRIEDVEPSRSLEFYLATPHWLDALSPPIESHLDKLVHLIEFYLEEFHKNVLISKLPDAFFKTDLNQGKSPLQVKFLNQSTGNPRTYSWEFGDGTTSTLKEPVHTYQEPGLYSVKLTVTNEDGDDLKIQEISLVDKPIPTFTPQKPSFGMNRTFIIALCLGVLIAGSSLFFILNSNIANPVGEELSPIKVISHGLYKSLHIGEGGIDYPSDHSTTYAYPDTSVNLWLNLTNISENDEITVKWIAPGNTIWRSVTTPISKDNNDIHFNTLEITNDVLQNSGLWAIQVFINDIEQFKEDFWVSNTSTLNPESTISTTTHATINLTPTASPFAITSPTTLTSQITTTIPSVSKTSAANKISEFNTVSYYSGVSPVIDPSWGSLSVSTVQKGAKVFVNQKLMGLTPLRITNCTPGIYQITLYYPGYQQFDDNVQISYGKAMHYHGIDLSSSAKPSQVHMDITTSPSSSHIYIDDLDYGKSPQSFILTSNFNYNIAAEIESKYYSSSFKSPSEGCYKLEIYLNINSMYLYDCDGNRL